MPIYFALTRQYKKQGGQRAAGMGGVEDDWDATPCVAAPNGSDQYGSHYPGTHQWGTGKRAQRKRPKGLEALPLEAVGNGKKWGTEKNLIGGGATCGDIELVDGWDQHCNRREQVRADQ